jgi:hypothetical protein
MIIRIHDVKAQVFFGGPFQHTTRKEVLQKLILIPQIATSNSSNFDDTMNDVMCWPLAMIKI